MSRLFSIVSLLIAVLWLPATLHCGLEEAGLWHADHDDVAAACSQSCLKDSCDMVEDGVVKQQLSKSGVLTPLLAACVLWTCENVIATETTTKICPERSDTPLELSRSWQFASRAARLPGEPSFAS